MKLKKHCVSIGASLAMALTGSTAQAALAVGATTPDFTTEAARAGVAFKIGRAHV